MGTATARQLDYVRSLAASRECGPLAPYLTEEGLAKLSGSQASHVIDLLKVKPVRADAPVPAGAKLASDKQVALAWKLLAERVTGNIANPPASPEALAAMASRDVSQLIDFLFSQPKREVRAAEPETAELEAGIYRNADGAIFKVQRAVHGSGRMTAKVLVIDEASKTGYFDYVGLASRFVKAADKMTLEEAKQFGAIYGFCVRCGATLTHETSIAAGIGPVCGRRF